MSKMPPQRFTAPYKIFKSILGNHVAIIFIGKFNTLNSTPCKHLILQIYIKFFLHKITHKRIKKIDFVDYICCTQSF